MLRLWYSVTDSFSSLTYTKDELIDDIYAVLNEWGYQVTEETDNQVAFIRNQQILNTRTPNPAQRDYERFTHSGRIEIKVNGQITSLKLTYAIEYWQQLIIIVLALTLALFTKDVSPFEFFLTFSIPIVGYKHYSIRKKCKEMLSDIISI